MRTRRLIVIILVFVGLMVAGCETGDDGKKFVLGAFQGFESISTFVDPVNLDLYRSLLPEPLAMPEKPEIFVNVVHYTQVGFPITAPYFEGYIMLKAKYTDGREGFYTITMPVTTKNAMNLGVALGFPKYIASKITLEQTDPDKGDYVGEVIDNGRTKIKVEYEGTDLSYEDLGMENMDMALFDGLVFQFSPPVYYYPPEKVSTPVRPRRLHGVKFNYLPDMSIESRIGKVKLTIDSTDPWAGLFPSNFEGYGIRFMWQGKADLVPLKLN